MVDHVQYHLEKWLAGTSGLTWQAVAVYRMLCDIYYLEDGIVEWDEKRLAQRCKMPKGQFRKYTTVLFDEMKIRVIDGLLNVNHGEIELERIKRLSEAGRKAINKRWAAHREKTEDPAAAGHFADTNVSPDEQTDLYDRIDDPDTIVIQRPYYQDKGKEKGLRSKSNSAAALSLSPNETPSSVPQEDAKQENGLHSGEDAADLTEADWLARMEVDDEPY